MNLLLIDDHPLFALGFAHALSHGGSGAQVRTAATTAEGLAVAQGWPVLDAVLIDYHLAGEDGLQGLRRFGTQFPLVARILISGEEEDAALVAHARAAGAAGFIGKSLSLDEIQGALERVCAGGEHFQAEALSSVPGASPTARQLEVLALVARGQQNKQIAHELGIAERTVKLHITSLLTSLHARNRTHLLVRARDLGLLPS